MEASRKDNTRACPQVHVGPAASSSEAISRVAARAVEWAELPPSEKAALFRRCLKALRRERKSLTAAACAARGYVPTDRGHAHLVADANVLCHCLTASWIRGAISLMEALAATGKPPVQGDRVTARPDGSSRIRLGQTPKDWLLGNGVLELVVRGIASQKDPKEHGPSVTGVLGAGNSEILNDILSPLCVMSSVVVYKSNPVMDACNQVKERVLAPLIERGFVAFVYGDKQVGKEIVDSELVNRVVLTGSHRTFDSIVWGQQDKHSPLSYPLVSKPLVAELGSVNPYIVVPGDSPWAQEDLEAQAEALVAVKLVNGGHVCAAPQVLVTCRSWPQREAFLQAVRLKIAGAPLAKCYYPGAEVQYRRHAEDMGSRGVAWAASAAGALPVSGWPESTHLLFEEGLDPSMNPIGLVEEAFSPILYEVTIESEASLPNFLPKAACFCRERVWGNLSCTIIVDDASLGRHGDALDHALDGMQFGTIGVNCPPCIANMIPGLAWGGVGNSTRDVQSGIGMFGNFHCYQGVQRSILKSHFRNFQAFRLSFKDCHAEAHAAKQRSERLADAFHKMSYRNLLKVAHAEVAADHRHATRRMLLTRLSDLAHGRPRM